MLALDCGWGGGAGGGGKKKEFRRRGFGSSLGAMPKHEEGVVSYFFLSGDQGGSADCGNLYLDLCGWNNEGLAAGVESGW